MFDPQVVEPDPVGAEVAALTAERAGYVVRGLEDRVAQVDERLEALGRGEAAARRAAAKPVTPRRRSARPVEAAE